MITSFLRCCQNSVFTPSFCRMNPRLFSNALELRITSVAKKSLENSNHSNISKIPSKELDLTFEEFRLKNIESYDDFKKSVESICNDEKKLLKAYEAHCHSEYFGYQLIKRGGNPALMI